MNVELSEPQRLARSRRGPVGEQKRPTTADEHIAARLRELRTTRGLSQAEFARMAGLTQQQLGKYETGRNRVMAAVLWEVAQLLSTSIDYFYEGIDETALQQHQRPAALRELARNLAEIREQRHLEALSQLPRALAGR